MPFNLYLVLLFCLPLPFAGVYPWAWGVFGFASFALLAADVFNRFKRARQLQLTKPSWPKAMIKSLPVLTGLLAVQIIVALQWLLGSYDAYFSLLQGLSLCAFFALTLLILDSRQRIERAIWLVILAAGFQALYGSLMVMTGLEYGFFTEKWAYLGKATGTFVNRNHLAGYLEMTLALGIGYLLASTTRYHGDWQQRLRQFIEVLLSPKVIMRLTLAIMVIGLVMSRSRMGNTAFFASLMITGALALLLMKNKSRSTTILLSSLLVIDIAIVGTFFGVEKVAERLQGSSIEKESRDEVSRDTFNMWLENPLLGTGAGSYKYVYPSYKSSDVTSTQLYDYAHNDYLQFLAEFGALAFLLLAATVLLVMAWSIRAMMLRRRSLNQGLGFASFMGVFAILIHSTVDFNLQIPANAYLFVFMLAMGCIARWGLKGRSN